MNHHPYDTWLLADEPLTTAQAESLGEHLLVCGTCRHLQEGLQHVDDALRNVRLAEPESGFVGRWRTRQAHQAASLRQSEAWWMLAGLTGAAAFLAAAIPALLLSMQDPLSVLAANLIEEVVRWVLLLRVVTGIGTAVVVEVPVAVFSAYALYLTLLVLATSAIAAAWSLSFRHLSQRGVQS
jgi:hypothetical protein